MNKTKQIYLDTNALMAISEFKLDVFTEISRVMDFQYQIYVLSGTLDELDKIIVEQRGKYKLAAKIGKSLLLKKVELKKVKVVKSSGHVDEILVGKSAEGALILTQDMALKRKLKKPYLTIRQKQKVIMVK